VGRLRPIRRYLDLATNRQFKVGDRVVVCSRRGLDDDCVLGIGETCQVVRMRRRGEGFACPFLVVSESAPERRGWVAAENMEFY
jgi:hypothetical protein